MITQEELLEILIGLPKEYAFKLCKENNIPYRVVMEDSNYSFITHDLRFDRLNLKISNGIIIDCYLG